MSSPVAMFVIDMQQGAADECREVFDLAQRIAAHVAQDRYEPVVASRFVNEPGSTYDRLIGSDLRRPPETALLEPIESIAGQVVASSTYSSLTEEVTAALRARNVREVHVCGVDTDQCVLATVFALFDAGFEPIVHADLCLSASGPECHEAGLVALRRAIGEERVVAGG